MFKDVRTMKRTFLLFLVGLYAVLLGVDVHAGAADQTGTGSPTGAGVRFPGRFAPSEGFTNRLEKPYRDEVCLNGYWNFQPGAECTGAWDSVRIRIPSPWNVNGFAWNGLEGPDHRDFPSYPVAWNEVRQAWMQRTVRVPADWAGDRIILHFEAVAGKAQVFVNGEKVAENFDLFLPFEADVTEFVRPGTEADVRVFVQSQKLFEDHSGVGRRIVPAGSSKRKEARTQSCLLSILFPFSVVICTSGIRKSSGMALSWRSSSFSGSGSGTGSGSEGVGAGCSCFSWSGRREGGITSSLSQAKRRQSAAGRSVHRFMGTKITASP